MSDLFLFGTLCHLPLLRVVLGRSCRFEAAELPDHRVYRAKGHDAPVLVPEPGARAGGLLLRDLSDNDLARVDYYEFGFGYARARCTVETAHGPVDAEVYLAEPGSRQPGAPWSLAEWERDWAELTVLAATEYMDGFGTVPPDVAASRFDQMRQRAASVLRARTKDTPCTVRSDRGSDSIQTVARRRPYSNFFTVEEHDLRFALFRGGVSAPVTRAGFVGGDAVTVLPYDPVRDRVLVIEQFRFGPHLRGDPHPWALEPVAGRIDPGETPEQAVHRELEEEAGIGADRLLPVASYYPSPGAWTEYLFSFVALADLPDDAAGLAGVADEAEDIRTHVLSFEKAMALVASGEVETAPLILTLLWLEPRRAELAARA